MSIQCILNIYLNLYCMHFRFFGERIFSILTTGASKVIDITKDNAKDNTICPKNVII